MNTTGNAILFNLCIIYTFDFTSKYIKLVTKMTLGAWRQTNKVGLVLGGHEKPPVEETWVHPGCQAEVHSSWTELCLRIRLLPRALDKGRKAGVEMLIPRPRESIDFLYCVNVHGVPKWKQVSFSKIPVSQTFTTTKIITVISSVPSPPLGLKFN